jgi:hypothetical protein
MRLFAILAVVGLSIAESAFGQTGLGAPPGAPIGMATRLVVVYGRLESELAAAGGAKLEQLLAPDFEELDAAAGPQGQEPVIRHIPRDAWIKRATESDGGPSISQIAVHDQGDLRMVSYVAWAKGKHSYVVDVWKGSELSPVLATRYRTAL